MTPTPRLVLDTGEVALDRPLLMGVVNATTNSFSDAGEHPTLDSRLALAERLLAEGADLIDVGGQSAVTNVGETPAEEEAAAVVPIVEHLRAHHPGLVISIDTYKPEVAEATLAAGASLINDTSGLRHPELAEVVAAHEAGLVVMHNRSRPKERLTDPDRYDDVVEDVLSFLAEKLAEAEAAGVAPERTVVDPGIDFAKTPHQTVEVLRATERVCALGRPVLLAISRKDFIGAIAQRPPRERLGGTLAAVAALDGLPGLVYRVHDVAQVHDFLLVLDVLAGREEIARDLELPVHLRRATAPASTT